MNNDGYDGFLESSSCTKMTTYEWKRVIVGITLCAAAVAGILFFFF